VTTIKWSKGAAQNSRTSRTLRIGRRCRTASHKELTVKPLIWDYLSQLTDLRAGQRLKSKMETLESFRDTVTAAKLSEFTATSPEVDPDTSKRNIPHIVKQLPIASFNVPVLGDTSGCNKSLSYFDIPTTITRHGFQTPPIETNAACDSNQDPLPLSSWNLGDTYSMVLEQPSGQLPASRSPCSNLLSEVCILLCVLMSSGRTLTLRCYSIVVSPHQNSLTMARRHFMWRPRAADYRRCRFSCDCIPMCSCRTGPDALVYISLWKVNNKTSSKNYSSTPRVLMCKIRMAKLRCILQLLLDTRVL
jgi:hypothetical protein